MLPVQRLVLPHFQIRLLAVLRCQLQDLPLQQLLLMQIGVLSQQSQIVLRVVLCSKLPQLLNQW